MSPGSTTESYPAFARIGLRENPGKNLNQSPDMNPIENLWDELEKSIRKAPYLLTYLLAFKEPGGSLPPSHKPAIDPYPEQD
ncbi:hypothetical protein ANN_19238 [Periplaneta americana]|uniref:Uncharacterized protein n=1 Tax=Periplaneta americana TaxID=6978 RepID=A0ABQ8S9B1_PERAM|nr:hypothetical protein ANN_19238 [Periplaneta americana]